MTEKPRGTCPYCDRSISLYADGTLRHHNGNRTNRVGSPYGCQGTRCKPAETTRPTEAAYCWHHETLEPLGGSYRQCCECKHVYSTAETLQDAWRASRPADWGRDGEPDDPPPADQILFCPLCLRDL
jgi:hypothetical protein